jgi:hypothetical protein
MKPPGPRTGAGTGTGTGAEITEAGIATGTGAAEVELTFVTALLWEPCCTVLTFICAETTVNAKVKIIYFIKKQTKRVRSLNLCIF